MRRATPSGRLRQLEICEDFERRATKMYLTRPKSSKGRSRPAVMNSPLCSGTQSPPESPVCSGGGGGGGSRTLRSQSQPIMWPTSQVSQDQVLHMLQHAPTAPPQSLNKYKVLPSIEGRQSQAGLDKKMSKIKLSDETNTGSPGGTKRLEEQHAVCSGSPQDAPWSPEQAPWSPEEAPWSPEEAPQFLEEAPRFLEEAPRFLEEAPRFLEEAPQSPKRPLWSPDEAPCSPEEAGGSGSLLLAIRAPCGRRFLQHFEASDTLRAVKASAEIRYQSSYRGASIETMDLPRRIYRDLDATLAECGIVNRSMLYISSRGDRGDEQDPA